MKTLLSCSLVVASLLALTAATGTTHHGGIGTDVTIAPKTAGRGDYLIRVKVTDLATGTVLAGPSILVRAGQQAEADTTISEPATKVTVKGTVDSTAQLASYSVIVRQGDEVLSSHTAKIALR